MLDFNAVIGAVNDFVWSDWTLYVLMLTGVVFTVWSRFSQIRALTHGTELLLGRYDDRTGPGALRHFQTLSAALSGTVGLGNIGGVAIAVALGGPGAVFWMWVVGFIGMAIKSTEVILSMLYRNVDDPANPHGGPMWVARKAFAGWGPGWQRFGRVLAVLFCITLIIATITGISFFQMWNVANITENYFGIPGVASSIVMAILVAAVVIGGIRRLGAVAGWLVPFMIVVYIGGGLVLLLLNVEQLPAVFASIFRSAFSPHEATGAFIGGTAGYAFLFGMKRSLYSNEAGQGSSPIVHAAARTREPVREGIVAGLEPFIDTLIVCTFSALVILVSGVWSRAPDAQIPECATDRGGRRRPVDVCGLARARACRRSHGQRAARLRGRPRGSESPDRQRSAPRARHGTVDPQRDSPHRVGDARERHATPALAERALARLCRGDAYCARLRHGLGRLRQVAGDDCLLAVRILDDDLLDLLRRAGRRLHVRRAYVMRLPDPDLPADGPGGHPSSWKPHRGGRAHDARHRRHALGQHPAHHPARRARPCAPTGTTSVRLDSGDFAAERRK